MIYSTISYLKSYIWPASPKPLSENDLEPSPASDTTLKTDDIAKKSIESPTFWSRFLGIKNLLYRVYSKMINFKKNTMYKASLIFTLLRNRLNPIKQPWFSKIEDEEKGINHIVLGGIPLGDINLYKKTLGINSVLSLLEDFEYQKTFFSTPISIDDWEKAGINLKKINAKDFLPLEIEEIEQAVDFLDKEIKAGNKVYVHCKAGKGRSVTVVCCYLIAKKKMSAQNAIDFVKAKRPNIHLNKHQRARIFEYDKEIEANRKKPDIIVTKRNWFLGIIPSPFTTTTSEKSTFGKSE